MKGIDLKLCMYKDLVEAEYKKNETFFLLS